MRPLLGIYLVTVLIGLSAAATCPATGTARVAHSMSCERYFECSNGVGVEPTCTGGLFFNVQRQECTNPREANCTVPKTVCPPPVVDELIVLADGKNCHNFFICFNGAPMPQQCAPARVYNRNTYNCDESVCRVSDWECPVDDIIVADQSNCSRYYHCHRRIQYNIQCPGGYVFDPIISRCVDPRFGDCVL